LGVWDTECSFATRGGGFGFGVVAAPGAPGSRAVHSDSRSTIQALGAVFVGLTRVVRLNDPRVATGGTA